MARNYDYVIRVDGKEVWRGKHPKDKLFELKNNNLNKRVFIAWQSDDDALFVPWEM